MNPLIEELIRAEHAKASAAADNYEQQRLAAIGTVEFAEAERDAAIERRDALAALLPPDAPEENT